MKEFEPVRLYFNLLKDVVVLLLNVTVFCIPLHMMYWTRAFEEARICYEIEFTENYDNVTFIQVIY